MIKQMARRVVSMGLAAALTACGGAQMEAQAPGALAMTTQPAAAPQVGSHPAPLAGVAGDAGTTSTASTASVQSVPFATVTAAHPLVSESERRAEELRMVDFEQLRRRRRARGARLQAFADVTS